MRECLVGLWSGQVSAVSKERLLVVSSGGRRMDLGWGE